MSLLSRIWNLVVGRTERAVEKVETPEDKLRRFNQAMAREVEGIQLSVTTAIADEKKLRFEVEDQVKKAVEWENRAKLALDSGREDLAREALRQREESVRIARELKRAWETQHDATARLKESLKKARTRVEEEKRQYNLLTARYETAKAKRRISQTLVGTGGSSTAHLVDQLNDKILRLEAEAEAQLELQGTNVGSDLEREFAALEGRRTADAALARLRGDDVDTRQLGPGQPGSTSSLADEQDLAPFKKAR